MKWDNINLPDKISLTDLQIKLYKIASNLHDRPESMEQLNDAIKMIDKISQDAQDWRNVFFKIANKIN